MRRTHGPLRHGISGSVMLRLRFSPANWTNADDSRNYLPIIWQVSQEPRFRHARTPRRRRAEAIRAPAPAMPARGATGVCTPPAAVFLPRRNASRWKRFLRAGRSSRHLRSFPFQRNKNPRAEKPFEALAHKRLPADGKSAHREVPLHDANAGGQTAPAANAQPALILARMVGLDPRAKLPSAGRYVHIGWQEFLPRCHRLRQVEVVPMRATRHRVAPGRPVSQ